MQVMKPRVSYADLERAPEDGRRYELYDGEVFVVPSPLPRHQIVADKLGQMLNAYANARGGLVLISPIDIVFSQYDVVQPDLVFFQASRRHFVQLDAPIRHAPDLAVEVLSPSTTATDRGKKMHMLERYGVQEYWIVDSIRETIEIYTLAADEARRSRAYSLAQTASASHQLRSPLLSGLTFPTASIFPAQPP